MSKKRKFRIKKRIPDKLASVVEGMSKEGSHVVALKDVMGIETISTGSLGLDLVLGGGIPLGYTVELRGEEGSFKTTLALEMLKEVQKANHRSGVVAFIDVEQSLNPELVIQMGIDPNMFIHACPDTGEEAWEIIRELVDTGVGGVVLDSVGAMVSGEEADSGMADARLGSQARLMWKAYRRVRKSIFESKVAAVFINQTTDKIGSYHGGKDSKGGMALKYWSFLRIDIAARAHLKANDDVVYGQEVNAYCFKNKMASPFKKAKIPMTFGYGVDRDAELMQVCKDTGVIETNGAWMTMPDGQKVSGREKFQQYIEDHPKQKRKMRRLAMKRVRG